MASQFPPKRNTSFVLYFSLYKNDGTIIGNPGTYTKKISKDGGGVADIVASVTEVDTTYGECSLVLSNTEMNADAVWVYIKDDTSGCVPFTCTIYTTANLMDDIKTDTAAVKVQTDKMAFTVENQIDANTLKIGGTTQTGRDVGASVLLSSGTGTGQLDFTSGVVKSNLVQILASAIAGTAAQISAAFTKFFDKASPTGTINSLPDAIPDAVGGLPITGTRLTAIPTIATVTTLTNLPAVPTDWLTAAGVEADAVTKIQTGLATPTNITAGTITTVGTCTTNTDMLTAAAVKTAIEATGSDLDTLIKALVNKRVWTETGGALEMFSDAGASLGSIAAQVTSDGTYTTAKRAVI